MLRKMLCGIAASAVLALLPGMAIAQSNAAEPVDPPAQVAELRQQFEGLTTEQIEAEGYVPTHGCIPNPQGPGAMGTHAINHELLEAQFPNGTMDPANPPVLLVGQDGTVMGVEWEAADVGQGPVKMFGQSIEVQPGHPGAEEPHYMLHIYFKADGKVLFGTNPQTAFDPELSCPEMPATAAATSTATASSSASALAETGGAFSLTPLAPLALLALLVGTGVLAFRVVRRD